MMDANRDDWRYRLREAMNDMEVPLDEDLFPRIMETYQRRRRMRVLKRIGGAVAAAAVLVLGLVLIPSPAPVPEITVVPTQEEPMAQMPVPEPVFPEIIITVPQGLMTVSDELDFSSTLPVPPEGLPLMEIKREPMATQAHEPAMEPVQQTVSDNLYLAARMEEDFDERRSGPVRIGLLSALQGGMEGGHHGLNQFMGVGSGTGPVKPGENGSSLIPIETPTHMFPLSLALQLQFPVTDRLSLGNGLSYSLLGSEYEALKDYVQQVKVTQQIHYLGIPLQLSYRILGSEKLGFYANVGGMVEKAVRMNYRMVDLNDHLTRHDESVSGVQWSANLGLGLEYRFVNFLGLFVDPSIVYYFDTRQPLSLRTVEPLQMKLDVGLRFYL